MVWKWWLVGIVILALSACGEEDREKPWWEVDPLNPPVEIVPPEWSWDCHRESNPAFSEEALLELNDHPKKSHPACVRPEDGYGGKGNYCGDLRDEFYCNACADDQWEGCTPCIWAGFAHEVDGQCIASWLCVAEERNSEFTDMPWEDVKYDACIRLNSPGSPG